jgi:hypothetical protein
LTKTKAAETYAALTKLTADGLRLADAVRQLGAETGRSESAIRASYYQQRTRLGVHGRRPSRAPISAEETIRQARQLLEQALATIDEELAAAKADADAALEHYQRLQAQAAETRSELQGKIAALNPSPTAKKGGTPKR